MYSPQNSSFRDVDGSLFYYFNQIYRSINFSYQSDYDHLINSGLYDELVKDKLLISHVEQDKAHFDYLNKDEVFKIIKPDQLSFISYPYEWDFYALRSAAITTLKIQLKALEKGMVLKDATAFNIQLIGSKTIFIDTLSFQKYEEGTPWVAYRQFCQHFLAPLLLWSYGYEGLNKLSIIYLDGIPLKLASKLLPFKSRFNLLANAHIHIHQKYESNYSENQTFEKSKLSISKQKLIKIIEHLLDGIRNLELPKKSSNWINYYDTYSYNDQSFDQKSNFVENIIKSKSYQSIVDCGCNTGYFSILSTKYCQQVISFDFDPLVISRLLIETRSKNIENITPLVIDLSNPTPSIGWDNTERESLLLRLKNSDCVLALALIHHLCIGNNVPLSKVASLFATIAKNLIIEFVPKSDIQVNKLLVTKKDTFQNYTLDNFLKYFSIYFKVINSEKIIGSDRVIFNLERILC